MLFLPVQPAPAAVKVEVTVKGIEDPLYKNVLARLTINLQKDNERLHANAVRRLHRQADEEIRSALAPFGYYNPVIKGTLSKDKDGGWTVVYTIDQGPPVMVQEVSIELAGAGKNNQALIAAAADFPLKKGDILNQEIYEQGKKKLINKAFGEGFLDAALPKRALRVSIDNNSAEIHLVLDTGTRYLFGETTSAQEILHQDLLDRYLPYKAGDPYNPAKLFELQSILYQTDYFSRVAVRGQLDNAANHEVPVDIDLTAPERRNKYSLGLGYATDTGARGKIDWKNRLFNLLGHQASASFP